MFPGDTGIPSQAKHMAAVTKGTYLACLLSSVTFTFPSTRLRYNLWREQSCQDGRLPGQRCRGAR